jgi:hypothetical protein
MGGDDQQALVTDRNLGIVMLVKAPVARIFHNPRLGVSEVVLVFVTDG